MQYYTLVKSVLESWLRLKGTTDNEMRIFEIFFIFDEQLIVYTLSLPSAYIYVSEHLYLCVCETIPKDSGPVTLSSEFIYF